MKYFGTDGIRGTALETLTLELAYKLGQAIVHQFGINKVLIGYDTRKSSPALAHALANGVLSQGANVLFAEEVSTPMVSYYSKTNELWAFMVTASHNPYTDNGIKVFNKGFKTVEQEEMLLEEMIDHDFLKVKAYGSFSFVDISQSYLKLYDNFSKTAYKGLLLMQQMGQLIKLLLVFGICYHNNIVDFLLILMDTILIKIVDQHMLMSFIKL